MARGIKFRAWGKSDKQMYDWNSIIKHSEVISAVLLDPEEYAPMQYTGLKDPKDIEIYESDVIERSYGKRLVVCWDHLNLAWVGIEYIGESIDTCCQGYQSPYHAYLDGRHCVEFDNIFNATVIGNIYENPELLQWQPHIT